MGTVHLTNGHHELYIRDKSANFERRVLLTPEMLNRPIFNGIKPSTSPSTDVIRGALQGLLDLPGFNAAVSYRVVERDGVHHIAMPKRVWGEITLTTPQDVVVGFSHDSGYDNRPYSSLLDWLEDEFPNTELSNAEFERFCQKWSSAARWRDFFKYRIRGECLEMLLKSDRLKNEGQAIEERATTIEGMLG